MVFPHERTSAGEPVGDASRAEHAIRDALNSVSVTFVGPKDRRTILERSALMLDDLRVRPRGRIF